MLSQVVLVAYFSARRWAPRVAERFGWMAYAFGALGALVGLWLAAGGASWRLWAGPVLLAAWAVFGFAVDIGLRIEWRTPVRPSVFAPYVTLYFLAQMFLWWPLWDLNRAAWAVFGALFLVNTGLNLRGHFGER